jgi:hypothetical protein
LAFVKNHHGFENALSSIATVTAAAQEIRYFPFLCSEVSPFSGNSTNHRRHWPLRLFVTSFKWPHEYDYSRIIIIYKYICIMLPVLKINYWWGPITPSSDVNSIFKFLMGTWVNNGWVIRMSAVFTFACGTSGLISFSRTWVFNLGNVYLTAVIERYVWDSHKGGLERLHIRFNKIVNL